jgi:hypothetical protein
MKNKMFGIGDIVSVSFSQVPRQIGCILYVDNHVITVRFGDKRTAPCFPNMIRNVSDEVAMLWMLENA